MANRRFRRTLRRRETHRLLTIAGLVLGVIAARGTAAALSIRSDSGFEAAVESDGRWELTAGGKRWKFRGSAGSEAHGIAARDGSDGLGAYREIGFAVGSLDERQAAIRLYRTIPAAIFVSRIVNAQANRDPFPTFRGFPSAPYHLSFDGAFFNPGFEKLGADAPWVFFDGDRHTFVLSPASHFPIARTVRSPAGPIACGIDPAIPELPAGYEQRTILVAGDGIGRTVESWGRALTALSGKTRPASDDGPDLARLGYWTDNGAAYYYRALPGKTGEATMLDVAARFRGDGIALGYLQLDSWWYPKGEDGGFLEYQAAGPPVFTDALAGFRQKLGLPLVVHGRWLSAESPIRERWKVSRSVVVDPGWWRDLADSLADAGVVTFEQDWLGVRALPEHNLTDPEAFLDGMAAGMAARGIRIQYCMAFPSDILQSTLYSNVTTCRASGDRFDRSKWSAFLHASLLARAVGLWPWADVFRSRETENLALALLSGGVVGVGDAIGEEDPGNLRLAARADGVLVKPDAPIVPTDATLVREGKHERGALVASTGSDFGGWRGAYVFADAAGGVEVSFTAAELGFSGPVFVFGVSSGIGRRLEATETFRDRPAKDRGYYVVVPVGRSGIAFLGDEGKLVVLGKKRIASVSDDGALRARVLFATGEESVRLHGFSVRAPQVEMEAGQAGPIEWDPVSGEFRVPVSPSGGEARVVLRAP